MVTRFEVGAAQVLYLDEGSLLDTSKNVRGGNPVLFPSPGPLASEQFARDGKTGSMKQHGFARQEAWSVIAQTAREVTLELVSSDVTRAQFPWEFVAQIRYALDGARLTVETTLENRSEAPLPFGLGFHPYFFVPDDEKAAARITTDATRAFDNVTKTTGAAASPIDLTVKEVDLHLIDHTLRSATLERLRDRITVGADASFGRWVVWTLAGKPFVCLEPWTAPANALNTGDALQHVPAGARTRLTVTIAQTT